MAPTRTIVLWFYSFLHFYWGESYWVHIKNAKDSSWLLTFTINSLCIISFRWWKMENQCPSHSPFVSWVWTIFSSSFPENRNNMIYASIQFQRRRLCFCRIVFVDFFLMNLILWAEGSSAAVPFGTLVAILALWFGISVPLTFVGAYFGFKKPVSMPSWTDQLFLTPVSHMTRLQCVRDTFFFFSAHVKRLDHSHDNSVLQEQCGTAVQQTFLHQSIFAELKCIIAHCSWSKWTRIDRKM